MVGKNIREVRLLMGFTQADFAKKIGMTAAGLSQIESGKRNPAFKTVQKILKVFNVDPKFLFRGGK